MKDKSITKEGCEYRSDYLGVSNVEYDLTLALPRGEEYFGEVFITFNMKKGKPLVLDFIGKEIYDLKVNGRYIFENVNTPD
jgi:hypothetical protein